MFKNLSPTALGVSGHQSEIIELALTYGFAGMDLDVADFATRAKLRGMPYARRLIDSANIRLGTFRPAPVLYYDHRGPGPLRGLLVDHDAHLPEVGPEGATSASDIENGAAGVWERGPVRE